MRISRASIGGTVAVGAVLLTGAAPAATADTPPTSNPESSAIAKATKKQKLKRLKTLSQGTKRSAADWRQARAQAKAGHDKYNFNWNTDWCTNLKDKPGGFDFRLSCARHDFGYRNYKALIGKKAFRGSAHERRVDRTFRYDMQQQCENQPGKTDKQRAQCLRVAESYYDRVS